MKLLFDTHAFIWWDDNPSFLGKNARGHCLDRTNDIILSVASLWEMQIKIALGKLTLRKPLARIIEDQVQQNGIKLLPIEHSHIYQLETLPMHHKDPFDRLLIAQAICQNYSLISHDTAFSKYAVTIIW